MALSQIKEPVAVLGARAASSTRRALRPVSRRVHGGALPSPVPGRAFTVVHEGSRFAICSFDRDSQLQLRFLWRRDDATAYGSLSQLRAGLAAEGQELVFAINGGIYGSDMTPLGLFISDGQMISPLNRDTGRGNFFLQPNGVLQVGARGAAIVTSQDFRPDPGIRHAVQSGPMLVIDGEIHHRFVPDSRSRHIRAGAGVDTAGRLIFGYSDGVTNLHDFSRLFRDRLDCPNAFVLDGQISRMYLPQLGFYAVWPWRPLVSIIALSRPAGAASY